MPQVLRECPASLRYMGVPGPGPGREEDRDKDRGNREVTQNRQKNQDGLEDKERFTREESR